MMMDDHLILVYKSFTTGNPGPRKVPLCNHYLRAPLRVPLLQTKKVRLHRSQSYGTPQSLRSPTCKVRGPIFLNCCPRLILRVNLDSTSVIILGGLGGLSHWIFWPIHWIFFSSNFGWIGWILAVLAGFIQWISFPIHWKMLKIITLDSTI